MEVESSGDMRFIIKSLSLKSYSVCLTRGEGAGSFGWKTDLPSRVSP